jgi:hypothetical protein
MHAAWHSLEHPSHSAFRRDTWDACSTSETYGPGTLPDRGSLGIESETTQTGIDWAPRECALLTRGSFEGGANPTNSGLFRRVRACWKRRIACKLPHEEHQFSAIISETRFSHWRRPHASMITRRGPRRLEIPTTAGSMTREAARCFSPQSVPT